VAAKMSSHRFWTFFPLANPTEQIKMGRGDQDARAPIAAFASKSFDIPPFARHCYR
jgi:hypothetical protein